MINSIDPAAIKLYPETGKFPIAVQAADPDGKQAFYFVKKEDAHQSIYRTKLSISNISGKPVRISKSNGAHFTLRFRPGLLNVAMVNNILPLKSELTSQLGKDWVQDTPTVDDTTGVISVAYRYMGEAELSWSQQSDFSLQLRPAPFPPLTGAFFVKLEIALGGIVDSAPLTLNLAAVDLTGSTFFPATAVVDGSNTILNNGIATSERVIIVRPSQVHSSIPLLPNTIDHESGTTITVAIRYAGTQEEMATQPDVMGYKSDDANSINLSLEGLLANNTGTDPQWEDPEPNKDTPGWVTWVFTFDKTWFLNYDTPDVPSANILSTLQFTLSNIISSAADGIVNVYLHFHQVPGYADHTLIVPFQKGPVVIREQKVGIGTATPSTTLEVNGDTKITENLEVVGNVGIGTNTPQNKLDVAGAVFIGANGAGKKTAPENGLVVEGKVGIGTSVPDAKIAVLNIGSNDDVKMLGFGEKGKSTFSFQSGFEPSGGDNFLALKGQYNTNTVKDLMTWKLDGNVGVGTDTPSAILHVQKAASNATANTNSVAIFENDDNSYLSIITPSDKERGILFGEPDKNAAGGILYSDSSGLELRTGNNITRLTISLTGDVTIKTGRIKDKTGPVMPVGSVIAYAGATAPDGWLICDGKSIPENDGDHNYDDLRSVLPGEKLPNLQGRFVIGTGDFSYEEDDKTKTKTYVLNANGGTIQETLTVDQMPEHNHLSLGSDATKKLSPFNTNGEYSNFGLGSGSVTDSASLFHTSNKGGDHPHNNLPPYQVLNYIIKY